MEHVLTPTYAYRDERGRFGMRFVQEGKCSCGEEFKVKSGTDAARARHNLQHQHVRHIERGQDGQRRPSS